MLPTVWATSQEDAIAQTGWLITLYALGVVVGAPTIAGSVAKYPAITSWSAWHSP